MSRYVHSCTHWLRDPRKSPPPPHLDSHYEGAIGQQRQTTSLCNSLLIPILSTGAFVVPFLVMVVLVGMPLLLLELGLGQKLRLGAAAAWPKV
jgi:hypothetical protein